jgi:hypothetical protein
VRPRAGELESVIRHDPRLPAICAVCAKRRKGINLVTVVVQEHFGWLFRRVHQEEDFGIDGYLDVIRPDGTVTGQMLAAQIKYGESYFLQEDKWGFIYRGESKHFNYLANCPAPVLIVICDPGSKNCYWEHFVPSRTRLTESGWKLTIPRKNILATSETALEKLLPPARDHLSEIEEESAFMRLISKTTYINFVIARDEVRRKDVSRPRAFIDRLKGSRVLAYRALGTVEFSFDGYDHDERQLYAIAEVRRYVRRLVAALPELFFFARTTQPAHALRLFAMCLTTVEHPDGRSTRSVTHQVVFEPRPVGEFMMRMFPGLNQMTEWLEISEEENKQISAAVTRCLLGSAPSNVV